MAAVFLALAIAAEVVATTFLRVASAPDGRWWHYAIVIGGYIIAFASLGRSLAAGMPLAVGYAIWAALGVALVAMISWLVFKEPLTLVQIGGLAMVLGGVLLLELGGRHGAAEH